MKIEIIKGDITDLKVDAIVNPANSLVTMGGGLAKVILDKGGLSIKEEAQKKTPIKVGEAILTRAGKLPCKFIIHAPTMEKPEENISLNNVKLAMNAILKCAEENSLEEVAIPGLGTGVGKVSYQDAARTMFEELIAYSPKKLKKVIFVAHNPQLYEFFSHQNRII